ncbi:MAG: tetratricopeptide repeat protein [Desulfobacter sp.]|nr:MAG: tetratricopeptide repeat protein [Desulfobacter sp.]
MRVWVVLAGLALLLAACGTPEEKKMAFYDKGMAFFESGDLVKARLELKNAVQIDPEFAKAHHLLGKIALKQKNGKAAFQSFSTAVKFDPDLIDARLDLGKLFFAAKAWDRANAQVAEILGRQPDHPGALFLQASILLTQKKADEARAVLDSLGDEAKQGAEYHLLMASYWRSSGNPQKAGEVIQNGLALNPDSLPLILALTNYYGSQGDLEKVEVYLKKAVELSPGSSGFKFNLAGLYLRQKESAKALAIVNEVLADNPDNDRLRVAGAVLLLRGGLKDEGIGLIKEGMAEKPQIYAYSGVLSEIYLKTNKIGDAESVLKDFLALEDKAARTDLIKAKLSLSKIMLLQKRVDEAGSLIDQVIEEDPKSVDAHYLKGRIYLAKGDGAGAVSKFRAVITDYPDHLDGYLGLANAHVLNKDYDLAMDVLKTAQKKAPDSTGILKAMVRINLFKKDTAAAEKNLKKIVSLDPYNLGAIAGLGDFYLAMNRYDEAIEQYKQLKESKKGAPLGYLKTANALARQNKMDKALDEMNTGYEENKQSSVFITSLARLYIKEGRYLDAIEKLKEAIEADANNRFAWFSLANAYEVVKDYKAAMGVYEQIFANHPESWMAANNLAFYLTELGTSEQDYNRALDLAQKADTLNPGSPLVQDTLGWALYLKGDIDRARAKIEQAYEQMPENESIAAHLGELYHRLGKSEKAKSTLEKVAATDKDFLGRDRAVTLYKKFYEGR